MTKRSKAPPDAAAHVAWEQIAELARAHALVIEASGGAMLLAVPEEQRKADLRARTLQMHGFAKES